MEVHLYKNERNARSLDIVFPPASSSPAEGAPALTGAYFYPDGRGSEPAIGHDYTLDGAARAVGNNRDVHEAFYYKRFVPAARSVSTLGRVHCPDGQPPASQQGIDSLREGAANTFRLPSEHVKLLVRTPEGELEEVRAPESDKAREENQPPARKPPIELDI